MIKKGLDVGRIAQTRGAAKRTVVVSSEFENVSMGAVLKSLDLSTTHFVEKGAVKKDHLRELIVRSLPQSVTSASETIDHKGPFDDESEEGTQLYLLNAEPILPVVSSEVSAVNEQLIHYLANHPTEIYNLSPRKFEELVAELFHAKGFEILLTPRSRDGGLDIRAIRKDSIGTLLYLIECKRYAPERPVSVGVVRSLFGVAAAEHASCSIVATTSRFTREAQHFASKIRYQMSLHDYKDLVAWLTEYSSKQKQS